MQAIRVGIRASASNRIGGGHVMRCVTLGSALARRGASCSLYADTQTRDFVPPESAIELVTDSHIDDELVRGQFGKFDVFICDHYGLDARFEQAIRPCVKLLVVIDDLANRPHDCDLLVDMTLNRSASAYDGLLPRQASILAGVQYALIRPEFSTLRLQSLARRRSGIIERILISFGLTDPSGLCALTVDLLRGIGSQLPDFGVADIMIGSQADKLSELYALIGGDARFNVHVGAENPAGIMAQADIAIGAGGTTSWERCCLGLPTILVSIADNQNAIAAALKTAGAVILLPSLESFRADLPTVLTTLARDHDAVVNLGVAAAAICDGGGAERVAGHVFDLYENGASASKGN
ncbi:UDP-2,4-diacetamido-2,4,6-trideoxy-beta-L-altropyranose hydrolase [Bradyrhizobium sp.]|uniref:UDP-2,4-diacetamido-2,4, 6-trideoxy-beta-L-altropyranose hydrolase n=1 Tax=Bradyrhizobium sp. TaxID=376 RepID=UPI003C773BF8